MSTSTIKPHPEDFGTYTIPIVGARASNSSLVRWIYPWRNRASTKSVTINSTTDFFGGTIDKTAFTLVSENDYFYVYSSNTSPTIKALTSDLVYFNITVVES